MTPSSTYIKARYEELVEHLPADDRRAFEAFVADERARAVASMGYRYRLLDYGGLILFVGFIVAGIVAVGTFANNTGLRAAYETCQSDLESRPTLAECRLMRGGE